MAAQSELVRNLAQCWKTLVSHAPETPAEVEYSSAQFAKDINTTVPIAGRMLRFFKGVGIYDYRSMYGSGKDVGQKVYGRRLVSLDDGLTAIYKHFDAGRTYSWFEAGNPGGAVAQVGVGKGHHRRADGTSPSPTSPALKPAKVVVADERSPEVTRAVAGPEPEKPLESLRAIRKDEPEALIEAARQYANRTSEVTTHIEALKGLGVEVDIDKVMSGISLTHDPILATVAILLPYIDKMERTNSRLVASDKESKTEVADLRRGHGSLMQENSTLRAANKRLSERNVALQGAKTAGPALGESAMPGKH